MKCKLCGATYDEDNLYFCIGCGAMLRNPATGEIMEENADFSAPVETVSEETNNINASDDMSDAASDELLPKPSAAEPPLPLPEDDISDKTEEKPIAEKPTEQKTEKVFSTADIIDKDSAKNSAAPPPYIHKEPTASPRVQESAPTAETPAVKSTKVGAGRHIGAAIISLLAAVVLIAVCLLFSLKLGFTGENLHKMADNLDRWSVVNAEFDNMSLSDTLFYESDFDKLSNGFADKTEFSLFLAKADFRAFCADKIKEYADYIIDGKGNEVTLTENELVDFFVDNHEIGKEVFDYEMQTADYNSMRSVLAEKEISDKFSVGKIGWEIKFHLENIKNILSYLSIGILAAVFVLLLVWLAFAVKKRGRFILGYFGNIFVFSGLAVILAAAAVSVGAALAYVLTGSFLCYLSSMLLLPTAAYGACIGLVVLIAGLIFKKVKNSIKTKARIQAAKNSKA